MEGIPICSLYGNGEIKGLMLYGSLDTTGYLDWDSWDIFISRLMNKKFFVRKYGNLLYSKLSYRQGFLELTDVFFKKKVICVKGIKSCTCYWKYNTCQYRRIWSFKTYNKKIR